MKVIKPNTLPTALAGFARASTATYVDDAGVLQTAGVNVPRWQGGKLLVEGPATNIVKQSNNLIASPWLELNCTRSTGPVGLDGVTPSTTLTVPAAGASFVYQIPNVGAARREIWAHAKAGVGGILVMRVDSPSQTVVVFNLQSGTITSGSGTIVPLSGGWFRCGISFSSAIVNIVLRPAEVVGSSVHIDHVQIEEGEAVTSRIPTTTTAATRAADVLTGTGLLYTTATDATPTYAAGTTYAAGAQVAYDRSRYQSLQASNTGHTPDVSPTWWARLGPVNQWAMFDDQVSTQTVQSSGPLRVALQAGAMDSLAVLGVDADRVRLVVQDGAGGPVVYDQEQGMAAEAVANWFDYFFNDPTFRRTQALFSGIPPFGASVATLTFSGSQVKVGHVSYGRVSSLGGLRYGARAGIKDFSRKDTDDFGVTTFVRRANSKYLTGALEVEKVAINQVHNLLTSLTATPVVWIGSEDVYYSDTLLVFGFFRDFYCSIDYPTLAIYSLEIEGLI